MLLLCQIMTGAADGASQPEGESEEEGEEARVVHKCVHSIALALASPTLWVQWTSLRGQLVIYNYSNVCYSL
jgi:hypothetical protein